VAKSIAATNVAVLCGKIH